MTSTTPSAGPDPVSQPPKRAPRTTRTTRAVVLGGLAAGIGFAAVTGVSAASGTGSSSGSHSSTKVPAHPARGLPGMGWPGPGGPGGIGGPGGPGEGTITAITSNGNGYKLTVRTLQGTEKVVTTSSTDVTGPDLQSTSLSSSDVGRVVQVQSKPPAPPSSSSSSSSTTIDATGIHFVDPSVMGRVTKVTSDGYTLVGRDGQQITVTTSSTTRYLTGHKDGKPETTTTAPSYSVGEILFVSGTETTTGSQSASTATTSVSAVLVGKAPAGPVGPPRGAPGPRGHLPTPPSRSGSSNSSASASAA